MKCLVTGSLGFIGSHLVDYLLNQGHEVVGIDNNVSGNVKNRNARAKNLYVDINHYFEVSKIIETEKPDVIFHLAAVSRTPWAIEKPLLTYQTNVVGSGNILEAARKHGVKKVVLASSNIVYAAQSPYKTSKLAMESVALDYDTLYKLPTLCLRFSNVYGAVGNIPLRQHPDNVLMSLSESKRKNGYITIYGDGDKISRNFTHVSDICEALLIGAKSQVHGRNIDIMHEKSWTLNKIARFFNCEVRYIEPRKGDIQALIMNGPSEALELLGWKASKNLEDYITPYINRNEN